MARLPASCSASMYPERSDPGGLARDLKRIERTAREAIRAVRDFEREIGGDVHGTFLIEGNETQEDYEQELLDYVELAKNTYPGRAIAVIVVAHMD